MFINIKDHPELIKDEKTGAIISRDNIGRQKYRNQRQKIEAQEKRISDIENKVSEIDNKLDLILSKLK